MPVEVPADMESFVAALVSKRRFLSTEEVVRESLQLLQSRESLRDAVQTGFAQIDAGETVEAEKTFLNARKRIDEIERGNA
jgi:putative addiction module CopG family antidote